MSVPIPQDSPEVYRPVPGFPSYLVSNQGRVVSERRTPARELTPRIKRGYALVRLADGRGGDKQQAIHRLVLAAFVGPCPDGMEVRHLDGDRGNNVLSNLAYGTRSENSRDKRSHGTDYNVVKRECPRGHPYDVFNTYTNGGKRYCRTCLRVNKRAYEQRRQAKSAPVSSSGAGRWVALGAPIRP